MNIQKLRDMNLHAVADELEQLRAFKAVTEVQDGFREIVEAVAHIGVDFGYGNFALSQEHIEKARALLNADRVPPMPAPDMLCKQLEIVSRRLDKDGLFVMSETVNSAIAMLSAPSHSQQSAEGTPA